MTHVATFKENSTYPSQRVLFEDEDFTNFTIEGSGRVDASHLAGFDSAGELEWTSPEMRDWTYERMRRAESPAVVGQSDEKPIYKRTWFIVAVVLGLLLYMCSGCMVLGALTDSGSAETSRTSETVSEATASVSPEPEQEQEPVPEPEPESSPAPAEEPTEPEMPTYPPLDTSDFKEELEYRWHIETLTEAPLEEGGSSVTVTVEFPKMIQSSDPRIITSFYNQAVGVVPFAMEYSEAVRRVSVVYMGTDHDSNEDYAKVTLVYDREDADETDWAAITEANDGWGDYAALFLNSTSYEFDELLWTRLDPETSSSGEDYTHGLSRTGP